MSWILNLRWTPNGVICDPYMGSGFLLVAAKLGGQKALE
jgi:DNA modification methylase